MAIAPRSLALASGLALALTGVAASASAASSHMLQLHSTMMASHAMGSAVVAQTSMDDYKVTITAANLPAATMIRIQDHSVRHVYVAWASDQMPSRTHMMMGMLAKIPLHTTGNGSYAGTRTVMMSHVAFVFVTAEGSAAVTKPATPYGAVLISSMTR